MQGFIQNLERNLGGGGGGVGVAVSCTVTPPPIKQREKERERGAWWEKGSMYILCRIASDQYSLLLHDSII